MTGIDEASLRRRLREELTGLAVQPAPMAAISSRGRAVRTRRRIVAACLAAAAAAAAVLLAVPAVLPGSGLVNGTAVTMDSPNPAAPGGVFASGTADGTPWRLALRNIADPGLGCLPAVLLNGRHADLLSTRVDKLGPVGYLGFLTLLPWLHNAGFGFILVRPGVTSVTIQLANGSEVTAQTIGVNRCRAPFHLAGFAYADAVPTRVTVFAGSKQAGSVKAGWVPFEGQYHGPSFTPTGLWENPSPGAVHQPFPAGAGGQQGKTGQIRWQFAMGSSVPACPGGQQPRTAPGWKACWPAKCFIAVARGGAHIWTTSTCTQTDPPPRAFDLIRVPSIGVDTERKDAPGPDLTAYAGQVGARTSYGIAYLSDGSSLRLATAVLAERKFIGFAVAKRQSVTSIELFDTAGRGFATLRTMPASCGLQVLPSCPPGGLVTLPK
jgi:hypothetical protein